MFTYSFTNEAAILRSDGAMIPLDHSNADYWAFLQWVAAGNIPTAAPPIPPPTTIQNADFLALFTMPEQAAIQTACLANAQLQLGLTIALAQGYITLSSPLLANWMAGLVTTGAITADRSTAILAAANGS